MHRQREERKYVFAHFMVGNTYPYSIDDWFDDIALAVEHDIDGFVLNVGHEDWQKDRVSDCFEATSRLRADVPFSFFLSFDMSAISAQTEKDVLFLCGYLETFSQSPRMFRHRGKVVVSTFSGENSHFGQPSLELAWSFVKNALGKYVPIHLIPSFFIDPARYPAFHALDGAFNWNGGWPLHLTPSSSRREIEQATLDMDQHHLGNLHGRSFMAAVSPWFFTHYGPDSWNKNWIYRGDDWLFVKRWEQLIAMRDHIDIVQVISWNDYGESHYIGPIKGAQPNSQAWVEGYPHTAWLSLNQYFARAFRDGGYPEIKRDQIFMWARPHPKDADAREAVPRPDNWQLTDDVFWVVVFATAACKVRLYSDEKHSKSFTVGAGMARLALPLRVGSGMRARMKRGGVVVLDCHPREFTFTGSPEVYNFNAFVTMVEN